MKPRAAAGLPLTMFCRPRVVTHHIRDARWTLADLRIVVLSDFHICRPWTPLASLRRVVARTNALRPDLVLLGGDFIADRNLPAWAEPALKIIDALKSLRAPLGVVAVLGNHDWWDCRLSRATDFARNSVREALEPSEIVLLSNADLRLSHHGRDFWIVGIDSQQARKHLRKPGFDDAEAAFAKVPGGAATILLAHEPDYFALGDDRAFLQVSGHTHGGQMNLAGWRPIVPSVFRGRYAWGHIRESGRHLIVSGGIGYSGLPLRIFQAPEITQIVVTGALSSEA